MIRIPSDDLAPSVEPRVREDRATRTAVNPFIISQRGNGATVSLSCFRVRMPQCSRNARALRAAARAKDGAARVTRPLRVRAAARLASFPGHFLRGRKKRPGILVSFPDPRPLTCSHAKGGSGAY